MIPEALMQGPGLVAEATNLLGRDPTRCGQWSKEPCRGLPSALEAQLYWEFVHPDLVADDDRGETENALDFDLNVDRTTVHGLFKMSTARSDSTVQGKRAATRSSGADKPGDRGRHPSIRPDIRFG